MEMVFTILDCQGRAGIHCYDTNGNGINDPNEDINGDGLFNGLDCQSNFSYEEFCQRFPEFCNPCNIKCEGIQTVHVTCNGEATGRIIIPEIRNNYEYKLYDKSSRLINSLEGLKAGDYTLYISEISNPDCISSIPITITEPAPFSLELDIEAASCYGKADGQVDIFAIGGTAPYTYLVEGEPHPDPTIIVDYISTPKPFVNDIGAGNYTVYVNDYNGCLATKDFTIEEPAPIVFHVDFSIRDSVYQINVSGGTIPYDLSINGGAWVPSSTYYYYDNFFSPIMIRDANNCVTSACIGCDVNSIREVGENQTNPIPEKNR